MLNLIKIWEKLIYSNIIGKSLKIIQENYLFKYLISTRIRQYQIKLLIVIKVIVGLSLRFFIIQMIYYNKIINIKKWKYILNFINEKNKLLIYFLIYL